MKKFKLEYEIIESKKDIRSQSDFQVKHENEMIKMV